MDGYKSLVSSFKREYFKQKLLEIIIEIILTLRFVCEKIFYWNTVISVTNDFLIKRYR